MNMYVTTKTVFRILLVIGMCAIIYRNDTFETYLAAVSTWLAAFYVVPECIAKIFARKKQYDGSLVIKTEDDKDLYSFIVNTPFYELPTRDELIIKVEKRDDV